MQVGHFRIGGAWVATAAVDISLSLSHRPQIERFCSAVLCSYICQTERTIVHCR
jgi:hypothetical protein